MSKWLDLSLTCVHLSTPSSNASRQAMNGIVNLHNKPHYGQLYLGNILAANDSNYLSEHHVGAVLSVIDTSEVSVDSNINRLWIMAEDCESQNIIRFLDEGTDFIKENIRTTNVLVHCYAGISRSSSFVIAYMIKHLGYSLQEALKRVKAIRPQVEPNKGFMEQLKEFERRILISSRSNSSLRNNNNTFLQRIENRIATPNKASSAMSTHYGSKQKTFFKSTHIDDHFKNYQKQKNIENIWLSFKIPENKSNTQKKNVFNNGRSLGNIHV